MRGMQKPNYDDLIQCLNTLAPFSGAGRPPSEYLDLYYHAIDLATNLDEAHEFRSETELGLAFFVKNCSFETALNAARERSPAPRM